MTEKNRHDAPQQAGGAPRPIAIIGGGVSGLTLAYRLHARGIPAFVLEADSQFGGNISTAKHDGYVYDLGPDSFLKAKVAGVELCRELGLEAELITPSQSGTGVLVAHEGALYPMPEGLSLGVPKRPGPLLETPLLSGPAKLRAMCEPFVRRPASTGEESILEFTTRRLGAEMASRLAAPLLAGVFAGDAARISMDAAFPQLIALEKKYGSLFSGLNGGKSLWKVLTTPVQASESPFVTLKGGLSSLVDALCQSLPQAALRANERVKRVVVSSHKELTVVTESHEFSASHVVFAGPPWAAAKLFQESEPELAAPLSSVRGFSTATVFFGLDAKEAEHSLEGSGFIVPPEQAEILAATFVSSKWAGRAPAGKALVRAFVGGANRDIRAETDEELIALAHRELTRFLGKLGPIQFSRLYRYQRGTPQLELGYKQQFARWSQRLAERPYLSLIGSGYDGVGIPDCIRQANELAAALADAAG